MKKTFHNIGLILNHKLFLIAIICSCLYTLGTLSDRQFGWTNPKNTKKENLPTIHTDGSGYYAYLPQWFLYSNKPNYTFTDSIVAKYKTIHLTEYIYTDKETNKKYNKYYTGTAVCIAPFFLINHYINLAMYDEGDGYSKSYQFIVTLSALFYWLMGIIAFVKIAKLLNASNFSIALLITIISLGTNLNYYISYHPSCSHVYSFFAVSWFMYFGFKWARTLSNKYLFLLGFSFGFIFIIRPTNAVILLLLPFLFHSWDHFKTEFILLFKSKKKYFLLATIFALIPIAFHFAVKLNETGSLAINSYQDEGFDYLFSPRVFDVLFSYRKGFFTYAPAMLLIIPGIYSLYTESKNLTKGWFIVATVFLYITASWWCWWYGGGHGMRALIDLLTFFSLPILLLLNRSSLLGKLVITIFSITMIYYYQTMQYQYRLNIILYDNMTKEGFWKVFLKTDRRFGWMLTTKSYKINENEICSKKTLFFNPITAKWTTKKSPTSEYIMRKQQDELTIYFSPKKSWRGKKMGIRFRGKMMITREYINPNAYVNYFKNGNVVKTNCIYLGYSIDRLNEYQYFSVDYETFKTDSKYDSLGIQFTRGDYITKFKDLSTTFYSLEEK